MTGFKGFLKVLGYYLSTFFKIYTPFILMTSAFIHGVCSLLDIELSSRFIYLNSAYNGFSLTVVFYIMSTSKRMCKYHKMCTKMLALVIIEGIIYEYYPLIDYNSLLLISVLTSFAGMLSFLIFLICKHFTSHSCKR